MTVGSIIYPSQRSKVIFIRKLAKVELQSVAQKWPELGSTFKTRWNKKLYIPGLHGKTSAIKRKYMADSSVYPSETFLSPNGLVIFSVFLLLFYPFSLGMCVWSNRFELDQQFDPTENEFRTNDNITWISQCSFSQDVIQWSSVSVPESLKSKYVSRFQPNSYSCPRTFRIYISRKWSLGILIFSHIT